MTVEIRRAGDQWSVEVRGASIGVAQSQAEARELAEYWQARLQAVGHCRRHPRRQSRLSFWLARLLNVGA
jgi:hypothetical protein